MATTEQTRKDVMEPSCFIHLHHRNCTGARRRWRSVNRVGIMQVYVCERAADVLGWWHGGVRAERLQVNPGPLEAVDVKVCAGCKKRAPWCSCGKADYR